MANVEEEPTGGTKLGRRRNVMCILVLYLLKSLVCVYVCVCVCVCVCGGGGGGDLPSVGLELVSESYSDIF